MRAAENKFWGQRSQGSSFLATLGWYDAIPLGYLSEERRMQNVAICNGSSNGFVTGNDRILAPLLAAAARIERDE